MKKKAFFVVIILFLMPILFFIVDLHLAKANRHPLFAITTAVYKDGGTKEYSGLGYKVIDYNSMDGRQDVVFISPFFKFESPKYNTMNDLR